MLFGVTASDLALNVRHGIRKQKQSSSEKQKKPRIYTMTSVVFSSVIVVNICLWPKSTPTNDIIKIMTASFHAVHGHDFQEFQYIPGTLHNKALLKYITSVSVSVWVPAYTLRSVQVKYTRGHCPCVCVKCRFNATSPALLKRYSTLGV